jgi:hypothetical protein
MKKQNILTLLVCLGLFFSARADEGMWLPILLKNLESDMQAKGMKLSAEDIYSINQSSLKDAVLQFGGGCTGSVISESGLVITNHHCGFGAIQSLSTLKENYLENGFWASHLKDEKQTSLTVTFIIRIEDVTEKVLKGVTDETPKTDRDKKIAANIAKIKTEATTGTHYTADVKPFYYGAEYYLFVKETFTDIRLVGTPPASVGKFGGDTDNWVWPRHTADFSLFRIYADRENKPAPFSVLNVPYKPKKYLSVSTAPIQEGDFTMIMGFPGSTQQYLPSEAVRNITEISNPKKVRLRGEILAAMAEFMEKSKEIKLHYAHKQAGLANAWKKWDGEMQGLLANKAVEKKQQFEKEFQQWTTTDKMLEYKYGKLQEQLNSNYRKIGEVLVGLEYLNEAVLAPEIIKLAHKFDLLESQLVQGKPMTDEIKALLENAVQAHFNHYHLPLDQKILEISMRAIANDLPQEQQPDYFKKMAQNYKNDYTTWAIQFFKTSIFASKEKVNKLLAEKNNKKQLETLLKDPAHQFIKSFSSNYKEKLLPTYLQAMSENETLMRKYVQAQREMLKDKKIFYPDANLTLRVSYGNVLPYYPADGVKYNVRTTLDGMMQKENAADSLNYFYVPQKLKDIYAQKDFGNYAQSGKVPIAFIAANHTTGGNSGSPVLNAYGHLIGINFDRVWEGTMSDVMYDIKRCRNISVDTRFILFYIDKVAEAKHILEEISIAKIQE